MLNPAAYENSRPDGIGVLEIVEEPGRRKEEAPRFVPLRRTELRGEILGPLASLRLVQTYGFSRAQCDRVVEAVYRFPLPGDAAVTGVQVRFGDVEISAELKERGEAQADYDEAKRQGRQAALVTRESPDVFTLQVAGIAPEQEVTVETFYVQLARTEADGWSLRVPLTTAPRYVRGDELTAPHAQGQPLLLLRDPGHRFSLDLTMFGPGAVTSATHALATTEANGGLRVRLKDGEILPDRDCVLTWQPRQEPDRPSLQVLLHNDTASEYVYFLAMAAAPTNDERRTTNDERPTPNTSTPQHLNTPTPVSPGGAPSPLVVGRSSFVVPREVILLVDHSGSMEGAKWDAADWAVKKFLAGLTERDAFALGLFHNTTRWFSRSLRTADGAAVAEGVRFLEAHRDSGGTELGVALEQALEIGRGEGERARHVLIVTDAEVTDAGRIVRLAEEEARRADRRRISVLCIDAAPNAFLAQELAERGGGVARFLTSDPEQEDITTALDAVLAEWAAPVYVGLKLAVDRPGAQAAGHAVLGSDAPGWSAIDLGDMPAGRAVWVAGRAPRGEGAEWRFQLMAGDRDVAACQADLARERNRRPAMKALFGARRVLGLEFLIHSGYAGDELREQLSRMGYDPEQVLAGRAEKRGKVYAENARRLAETALRDLLVRESLEYGVASSATGFVAVRREAGQPVEGTVFVANALPAGWSEEFLGGGPFLRVARASMMPMAAPAAPLDAAGDPSGVVSMRFASLSAPTGVRSTAAASPPEKKTTLFAGTPQLADGEAVLFDSSREQDRATLPEEATFTRLWLRFPAGDPAADALDAGLTLLLFIDDLASPRARVSLAELVRQRGERPLNVRRRRGQVVRLVLADPSGAWAGGAPAIEVLLG